MVDLFGKKKLEDRIAELQASLAKLQGEKEQLLSTLEKRDEKISKLAAANQQANLALKAAEQRAAAAATAATTQAPVQAAPETEACEGQKPKARILSMRDVDGLVERLKVCRSPRDDLVAAYYTGPAAEDESLSPAIRKATCAIKSQRGGIVLHSPQLFTLLLVPPFPVQESLVREGSAFALDPLEEMMETPVLVLFVHAGETFLGVALSRERFEVEERVESSVMGKHSKGGWSQKRFERLREEEVRGHADLVAERLAGLMGRYKTLLKYAVVSGDEGLIRQIAPAIGLPLVERKLSRLEGRKAKELLDEVYGFFCYRIDV
ncbi:MAG: Peptide chain release factor subunit 1 [Methanosaeta sp. PtaU1.Bin112]|nr:MAG: Peptide chain release factor subunit 1 [Methanosaeta sp. PtaU1.Bin112]